MSVTRASIKFEILTRLNKSAAYKGFYTDQKLNSVIQECLDYISTEMFLADEGWNHKIDFVDTTAGQVALPVLPHWAMIADVRYLLGDTYEPMTYDQAQTAAQVGPTSGLTNFPSTYRIVDNQLYFNPPIAVGGAKYLQVEYFAYPRRLQKDSDFLDSQFDRSMFWAIIYMSCAKLPGQMEQATQLSADADGWMQRMRDIIAMRTRQSIPIQNFEG